MSSSPKFLRRRSSAQLGRRGQRSFTRSESSPSLLPLAPAHSSDPICLALRFREPWSVFTCRGVPLDLSGSGERMAVYLPIGHIGSLLGMTHLWPSLAIDRMKEGEGLRIWRESRLDALFANDAENNAATAALCERFRITPGGPLPYLNADAVAALGEENLDGSMAGPPSGSPPSARLSGRAPPTLRERDPPLVGPLWRVVVRDIPARAQTRLQVFTDAAVACVGDAEFEEFAPRIVGLTCSVARNEGAMSPPGPTSPTTVGTNKSPSTPSRQASTAYTVSLAVVVPLGAHDDEDTVRAALKPLGRRLVDFLGVASRGVEAEIEPFAAPGPVRSVAALSPAMVTLENVRMASSDSEADLGEAGEPVVLDDDAKAFVDSVQMLPCNALEQHPAGSDADAEVADRTDAADPPRTPERRPKAAGIPSNNPTAKEDQKRTPADEPAPSTKPVPPKSSSSTKPAGTAPSDPQLRNDGPSTSEIEATVTECAALDASLASAARYAARVGELSFQVHEAGGATALRAALEDACGTAAFVAYKKAAIQRVASLADDSGSAWSLLPSGSGGVEKLKTATRRSGGPAAQTPALRSQAQPPAAEALSYAGIFPEVALTLLQPHADGRRYADDLRAATRNDSAPKRETLAKASHFAQHHGAAVSAANVAAADVCTALESFLAAHPLHRAVRSGGQSPAQEIPLNPAPQPKHDITPEQSPSAPLVARKGKHAPAATPAAAEPVKPAAKAAPKKAALAPLRDEDLLGGGGAGASSAPLPKTRQREAPSAPKSVKAKSGANSNVVSRDASRSASAGVSPTAAQPPPPSAPAPAPPREDSTASRRSRHSTPGANSARASRRDTPAQSASRSEERAAKAAADAKGSSASSSTAVVVGLLAVAIAVGTASVAVLLEQNA